MKVVKNDVEKVEVKVNEPKVELCAISREFAINQINKLIEANKSIFDEYAMWASVINSPVNVVSQEETNIATKE